MTKKRILIASNYDDVMFTESFLNVPPVSEELGDLICIDLNDIDSDGPNFYKLVDMDYVPTFFEP